MEAFWKAAALIILAVILGVALEKAEKDISTVLTVTACCAVGVVAMEYLSEVVGFLWKLGNSSDYGNPFLGTLLKIAGVALVAELTGLLSSDAGNSSLGKAMQILGTSAILFLALPLFESLFSILQEIMMML